MTLPLEVHISTVCQSGTEDPPPWLGSVLNFFKEFRVTVLSKK